MMVPKVSTPTSHQVEEGVSGLSREKLQLSWLIKEAIDNVSNEAGVMDTKVSCRSLESISITLKILPGLRMEIQKFSLW